ncbi:MAG: preprotein translocase subunit SecA [Candidatus Omnitrophota bacterium]
MIDFIVQKIIGTQNEREIKRFWPLVHKISALEPEVSKLSDAQLRAKTPEFKERINKANIELKSQIQELEEQMHQVVAPEEKEKIKERLKVFRNRVFESVLPEAFAVVREVAKRTINMRHFDVQILGGIVLHEGRIAEMATGEGKTLVATLSAYLNALLGKGVHIVTVNDYLAKRDREWMGPIYEALGLSVGAIQHDMDPEARQYAYNCDIAYGTNNEFGFDYLRDNMVMHKSQMVQRPFYYAIVDEVDSILIDESRTPLIISGPAEESTDKYYIINRLVPQLKGRIILEKDEIDAKYKGEDLSIGYDYVVDEKLHTVSLSEAGIAKCEKLLNVVNLYDDIQSEWVHHIIQALRAHKLYKRDVDYMVKDGEVIIVDEFTGRLMPGRRWSDGLHQAVEAKEGVRIERENQTLATITFQNYFRLYEKLSGMTGTAATEANEFKQIYKLDVVVVPTNCTLIRNNFADSIYKSQKEKLQAVVSEIEELHKLGRPILVGTLSIEKSEQLSEMLRRRDVPHQVLNARYHELEAQIVAQAGRFGAVTIATNMAGRGTDILLGGNPQFLAKNALRQKDIKTEDENYQREYVGLLGTVTEQVREEHNKVVDLGGLHVIGTERHEARRIDNQLRGRSGRQGDPGSSRFYVSFEDDLMRLFAPEWGLKLLDKIDTEGQALTLSNGTLANMISKSIETAQKRVEQHHFEIRKHLLEYDNVMNRQRELIYSQRRLALEGQALRDYINNMIEELLGGALDLYLPKENQPEEWDFSGLNQWLNIKFSLKHDLNLKTMSREEIPEALFNQVLKIYEAKENTIGLQMRQLESMVLLQVIDSRWKDHLYAMDNLREGIGLRAYGQRDPLIEYQKEAFNLFSDMVERIKEETIEFIFKVNVLKEERLRGVFSSLPQEYSHPEAMRFRKSPQEQVLAPEPPAAAPSPIRITQKVGRNDPCPCGSGKKYKKCCGQ